MSIKTRDIRYQPSPVRWLHRVVVCLLLILPFIYLSGYGSYAAVRYFTFGTASIILGALTAWIWARQRTLCAGLMRRHLVYGLVVYIAAYLAASITSTNPALSFLSTFQRTDGFFALLFLSIWSAAIYTAIRLGGERVIYRLLGASVFGALILSVLIMLSPDGLAVLSGEFWTQARGGATIGNSSLAALYVTWNMFFAWALMRRASNRRRTMGWGLALVIMLTSPLFINGRVLFGATAWHGFSSLIGTARGGVMGLIIGAIVAVAAWLSVDSAKRRALIGRGTLAVLAVAVGITGGALLHKSSALHKSFSDIAGNTRFLFWDSALAGFAERPLLGWGPGTFSELYHRHIGEDAFSSGSHMELLVDKSHNIFFESLGTGGVVLTVGLIIFLFAFVLIMRRLLSRHRLLGALSIGAFATWLIQVQFIFDSVASLAMLFMLLGLGLAETGHDESEPYTLVRTRDWMILLGAWVGLMLLFIYSIFLPMKKAHTMYRTYTMNLPARVQAWSLVSGISPMGDQYDTALMLTRVYEAYMSNAQRLRTGDMQLRQAGLDELDALSGYVSNILQTDGEQYELLLLAAQLRYARIVIDPATSPPTLWDAARKAAERAIELSPADPRPQEILNFLNSVKKK